jgi:NAD(P)-dependent dehydrogenase (short-subunit alcohol dehydrogenase family)
MDTTTTAPGSSDRSAGDDIALRGRVALITGGAGGLGSALARVLGEAGCRLALADVAADRLRPLAGALAEQGIEAMAIELDVSREAAVQAAVDAVRQRFGRLDVLVNNAAIDITTPIDELAADDWRRIVDINLTGPFLMARAAAPALRERAVDGRGGGHIVNICSTASKRTWPNAAAYHATKWGLLGLSHALHAELRPQGVRVCAIVTGGMRTPFLLDRFPDIDTSKLQDPHDVARVVKFVLQQPAAVTLPEVMVLPVGETSWP